MQNTARSHESSPAHIRWTNAGVYHAGFPAGWTPNMVTLGGAAGAQVDCDIDSWEENEIGTAGWTPTFAAFTSHSYHPGQFRQFAWRLTPTLIALLASIVALYQQQNLL